MSAYLMLWLFSSLMLRLFMLVAIIGEDLSEFDTTPKRLAFILIYVPMVGDVLIVVALLYWLASWAFEPSMSKSGDEDEEE